MAFDSRVVIPFPPTPQQIAAAKRAENDKVAVGAASVAVSWLFTLGMPEVTNSHYRLKKIIPELQKTIGEYKKPHFDQAPEDSAPIQVDLITRSLDAIRKVRDYLKEEGWIAANPDRSPSCLGILGPAVEEVCKEISKIVKSPTYSNDKLSAFYSEMGEFIPATVAAPSRAMDRPPQVAQGYHR